ncbi:MAG: dihydroorotase [Verrucomicrobiota bacterium]
MTVTLPRWYDFHAHFRQGPGMTAFLAAHGEMGCAGALAMPNTRPPVSRVVGENREDSWSIEGYGRMLEAQAGAWMKRWLVPLYLTREANAETIEEGVTSGLLQACKYYPPHGTTNADHGVPIEEWIGSDVLRVMEERGVPLCLHGERHGLAGQDYFDRDHSAETVFYQEWAPRLREAHPRLRLVCEHITTKEAVAFVSQCGEGVGATITPQHLLFTVGHLLQGLKYHLYCLPLVKFEEDRAALREAVRTPGQRQFFAGTDSAPHVAKMTPCGCAAGCFTGGIAPQLYAMGFEGDGEWSVEDGEEVFRQFLCENGPAFYGWPVPTETFALVHEPEEELPRVVTEEGDEVTRLTEGMELSLRWRIEKKA